MDYLDVNNLDELPELPIDKRYFDTIGGSKNYRCFIAPIDYPRNKFLLEHESYLDKCLTPIYKNRGIIIRQDNSFPIPGFYIVSPETYYRSLDKIPLNEYMRLMFLIHQTRKGLRDICKVEYSHLIYEEKDNAGCNVHFWILPITDIKKYPRMYKFDIKQYMDSFNVTENYDTIIKFNNSMIGYFKKINLFERDCDIYNSQLFSKNIND